jgi:hypothetical protein
METPVDAVEGASDGCRVGHVGPEEFDRVRQVVAAAARQVVENPDCVAAVEQGLDEMRADKPSAASHKITSHPKALILLRIGFGLIGRSALLGERMKPDHPLNVLRRSVGRAAENAAEPGTFHRRRAVPWTEAPR